MPSNNGKWSVPSQIQAYGSDEWSQPPGAPTIGTVTKGNTIACIPFTAPGFTGRPSTITGYKVTSSPGCIVVTGSSSPIQVTGLTNCTAYTFKLQAQNSIGYGPFSAQSNSVTPNTDGETVYDTPGTYTFTAPSGVNSVSIVAVGGGGSFGSISNGGNGGGGGGLGYKNNISVTPGSGYCVVVGDRSTSSGTPGGNSYFINTGTVYGGGGNSGVMNSNNAITAGGTGGCFNGDGGGKGGDGGPGRAQPYRQYGGGGGAGGYSGAGGTGGYISNASGPYVTTGGANGQGGAGAGDGNGGQVGGGVGLFGQGSNGVTTNAQGGSGGNCCNATQTGNCAGKYGAGRGSNSGSGWRKGAVRVIYPGNTRSFPTTNVGPS